MTKRHLILCLALTACQSRVAAPPPAAPVEVESATRWSAHTELFVEYPPLAAGKVSRFAIHLTRLDNFKAIRQGRVEVLLTAQDGTVERFETTAPSRPGIFGVDVKPTAIEGRRLSIHLRGEGIDDRHELGAKEPEPSEETIPFLKEQQWTLDFGTAIVETRALSTSLRVPAEVTARPGGEAEIDAPFSGRLVFDSVPALGSPVREGQVLANLILPTSSPADVATLDLAQAEARSALDLARKDRARVERLVNSGAVPAKRLDEARSAESIFEARLKAAEARLAQYEASRQAETQAKGGFAIRSPIRGILQAMKTTPGATVKAGEPLFQIVDLDTVHVSAIVPESEFPRMRSLAGAELEIPGVEAPRPLRQLVMVGRVVDAPSRTFPVIYAFDNRERRVAINQTVYVRILFPAQGVKPVVPEAALVDDGGRPIVFVQHSGEAFARRPVTLGQRAGGQVEVLEGLKAGERVVTRGAHLIRLASLSSQVPAHGHVH